MTIFRFALLTLLLSLAFVTGCTFRAGTGGQRFEGGGVVFVVPIQTSKVTNGPEGIDYRSDKFNARTDGKSLFINDIDFGNLNPGDVVEFNRDGAVTVNGTPRSAVGTST